MNELATFKAIEWAMKEYGMPKCTKSAFKMADGNIFLLMRAGVAANCLQSETVESIHVVIAASVSSIFVEKKGPTLKYPNKQIENILKK
jgi:hypothetical protein